MILACAGGALVDRAAVGDIPIVRFRTTSLAASTPQRGAIGASRADHALLERLGLRPEALDAGCCGLAGPFGYRSEHEPLPRKIGQEQWLPKVRAAVGGHEEGDANLVVDGFSCVMQLDQLSDLESTTLVSIVRRSLGC